MTEIAIIGGTGLTSMEGLSIIRREMIKTPYGAPSGPVIHGELYGRKVVFLARHGHQHTIPPHRVNYRANIWALHSLQVRQVIAVAAVGGIADDCSPTTIVMPDQIVDYTYGRHHTFYDDSNEPVKHIDFSYPYTESLRQRLIHGAQLADVDFIDNGVYGITQGPRLETAAEIVRMRNDGCTLVGMTGMPEAALARELDLEFAVCAMVVNWAAGIEAEPIQMSEIEAFVATSTEKVRRVLRHAFAAWA